MEEKAFTSASKDMPPDYCGARADKPNEVRFVFENPVNARDIEPLNPEEREVMFTQGSRFEVGDVDMIRPGEWEIRMIDQGRH